jgi:hypothetical protein
VPALGSCGSLSTHKFDRRAEVTYRDLFTEAFQGTVRLVRLMEEELGRERAHELVYRSRVKGDLAMISRQLSGRKPIGSFAEFKTLMKGIHESRSARNMFTISYPVDNDDEVTFLTTECILAKVFRELEAEDIGYVMCCLPDFETTSAYCPRVCLKRSRGLMKGDECCDTTYSWKL